ncbi:MAG: hypothetical protein IT348_04390 [Candidatus Eisenbacteria bacterium]|nr:hypothetical protein [Candidatus Eisenbacteria bacterium]
MGRHFEAYVARPWQQQLPQIPGFPPQHPYIQLASKTRAAGVTGNIGEAVAGIVMARLLTSGPVDIAHIRPVQPFRARKSPDFMARLDFARVSVTVGSAPTWWPVESKARSTANAVDQAIRESIRQHAAYWYTIQNAAPGALGYGCTVAFQYQVPQRIDVVVFQPGDPARLATKLSSAKSYRDYVKEVLEDGDTLESLDNCGRSRRRAY